MAGKVSWSYVSVYTDDIWLKPRSKPPTWKKTLSSVPGENWQPDPMTSGTKLKPLHYEEKENMYKYVKLDKMMQNKIVLLARK